MTTSTVPGRGAASVESLHATGTEEAFGNAKREPRFSWRHVVSGLVFIVSLVLLWPAHFGGITGLTVVSGISMEPTYHTGDLVVSVRQPEYRAGDIVSYLVPAGQPGAGGRVIHRIFSVDASSGTTVYNSKGDNNPDVDPWVFTTDDIMGKALFSMPAIGSVLGGVTNPIAVGLASGLLVTLVLWRLGSKPRTKRHRAPSSRRTPHDDQVAG